MAMRIPLSAMRQRPDYLCEKQIRGTLCFQTFDKLPDGPRNEHMTRIKSQAHRCAGSCSPRVGEHNVVMDETLKARLGKVVEALKGGIANAACACSLVWNRRKKTAIIEQQAFD